MKTIVRRINKTVVSYQCEVCKRKYASKRAAISCEKRILEKQVLCRGDRVRNNEVRTCLMKNKDYFFSGIVTKIIGPEASDYDYEARHLGGKTERLDGHVFTYEATFSCPRCKEKRTERYFAPELKLIRRA